MEQVLIGVKVPRWIGNSQKKCIRDLWEVGTLEYGVSTLLVTLDSQNRALRVIIPYNKPKSGSVLNWMFLPSCKLIPLCNEQNFGREVNEQN